jgi:hypothetical protein
MLGSIQAGDTLHTGKMLGSFEIDTMSLKLGNTHYTGMMLGSIQTEASQYSGKGQAEVW